MSMTIPKPQPIEALLFDKDGTLFDFRRSWGRWARDFLASIADDAAHAARLSAAIGHLPESDDFDPASPVIAGTALDVAELLAPVLPGWSVSEIIHAIDAAARDVPMVEAVPLTPLFDLLAARGLRLGVATNDSERPARAHLARHGLLDRITYLAGADSGHGAKPDPGMCKAFLRAEGLAAGRCAMIGDSLHDLHAGRAAGMVCVAVLTGIAPAEVLAPHADVVLPDIGALPAWLEGRSW